MTVSTKVTHRRFTVGLDLTDAPLLDSYAGRFQPLWLSIEWVFSPDEGDTGWTVLSVEARGAKIKVDGQPGLRMRSTSFFTADHTSPTGPPEWLAEIILSTKPQEA